MLLLDTTVLVSADRAFAKVPGLNHVDPKSGLKLLRTSDPRVAREG